MGTPYGPYRGQVGALWYQEGAWGPHAPCTRPPRVVQGAPLVFVPSMLYLRCPVIAQRCMNTLMCAPYGPRKCPGGSTVVQ